MAKRVRKNTRSDEIIDTQTLRYIYSKEVTGEERINLKITISPSTKSMLSTILRIGSGGNASPFMELAARLLASVIYDTDNSQFMGTEISKVINSPYLPGNLRALANFIETRALVKNNPVEPRVKRKLPPHERDSHGRYV